jgi:hypothetical protein
LNIVNIHDRDSIVKRKLLEERFLSDSLLFCLNLSIQLLLLINSILQFLTDGGKDILVSILLVSERIV